MSDLGMPVRGIYHHFKDATKLYEVLGTAMHTEDKQQLVVYRALYAPFHLYVRPLAMFQEEVDKPEHGYRGPRFVFVSEIS